MKSSALPRRKVGVGALAGAITTLLIFAAKYAAPNIQVDGVSAAALTTVLTFIVSYVVPEGDDGT